ELEVGIDRRRAEVGTWRDDQGHHAGEFVRFPARDRLAVGVLEANARRATLLELDRHRPGRGRFARDLHGRPELLLDVQEMERGRRVGVAAGYLEPALAHPELRTAATEGGEGSPIPAVGDRSASRRERS